MFINVKPLTLLCIKKIYDLKVIEGREAVLRRGWRWSQVDHLLTFGFFPLYVSSKRKYIRMVWPRQMSVFYCVLFYFVIQFTNLTDFDKALRRSMC